MKEYEKKSKLKLVKVSVFLDKNIYVLDNGCGFRYGMQRFILEKNREHWIPSMEEYFEIISYLNRDKTKEWEKPHFDNNSEPMRCKNIK